MLLPAKGGGRDGGYVAVIVFSRTANLPLGAVYGVVAS
jgi:hypothetical protein